MAVDRRLDNVLRALLQPGHADPNSAEASRVYASATNVLATLTNPLNVSLLATQILVSPAIWQSPDGLRASLRTFSVFQSATLGKIESPGMVLGLEEWINSVVRGANPNVPRWRHILLLGGVLSADQKRSTLPRMTRTSLEDAFCRAVNMSLDTHMKDELEADVLSLVLSHSIQSLSRRARELINYEALLPAVAKSIYHSREGFQSGYFLPTIDHDIVDLSGKISWPSKSNSFLELQERSGRPLFGAMSRLARLAASAIREANDPRVIYAFLDSLERFAHTMLTQWKLNRLSEVPIADEQELVDEESAKATMPVVWQILKTVLFTTTMILQELMSKVIESTFLCDNHHGPVISRKILHICRGFYFITARIGPGAFSSYNFVYLTAVDLLSVYQVHAESFTQDLASAQPGTIPPALPDRLLDLFYLNTLEHLLPMLPRPLLESTVLPVAAPYLTLSPPTPALRPLFEAAHALLLSVISAPPHAELAADIVPFYVDAVFASFPSALSARQFRLAFSTLVRASSPPSRISETAPMLVDALLEVAAERARATPDAAVTTLPKDIDEGAVGLGEQEVCLLALIDSLPFLDIPVMVRWLDPAADLLLVVKDPARRERVVERFWDVLAGELDVARAEYAVRWWAGGGREKMRAAGSRAGVVEPRL